MNFHEIEFQVFPGFLILNPKNPAALLHHGINMGLHGGLNFCGGIAAGGLTRMFLGGSAGMFLSSTTGVFSTGMLLCRAAGMFLTGRFLPRLIILHHARLSGLTGVFLSRFLHRFTRMFCFATGTGSQSQ